MTINLPHFTLVKKNVGKKIQYYSEGGSTGVHDPTVNDDDDGLICFKDKEEYSQWIMNFDEPVALRTGICKVRRPVI